MSIREQGLRRVAAVSAGLAAASVAGVLTVAAVAWANPHPADQTADDQDSAVTSDPDAGTSATGDSWPSLFRHGGTSSRSGDATSAGS